jgi:hypothetical protein
MPGRLLDFHAWEAVQKFLNPNVETWKGSDLLNGCSGWCGKASSVLGKEVVKIYGFNIMRITFQLVLFVRRLQENATSFMIAGSSRNDGLRAAVN